MWWVTIEEVLRCPQDFANQIIKSLHDYKSIIKYAHPYPPIHTLIHVMQCPPVHLPVLIPQFGMLPSPPILLFAQLLSTQWFLVLLGYHFGASLISQYPGQDALFRSICVHCVSTESHTLDPSHVSMCSYPTIVEESSERCPVLRPVQRPS